MGNFELWYFIFSAFIAIYIWIDIKTRKLDSIWLILLSFLCILGLIAYLSLRKSKYDGDNIPDYVINILKDAKHIVEYRNNFAVKGYVVLYEGQEYQIVKNMLSKNMELKLVIPTSIRIIYSIFIVVVGSLFLSFIFKELIVLGFLIFIFSTYIVDFFYKDKRKKITKKINEEILPLINNKEIIFEQL